VASGKNKMPRLTVQLVGLAISPEATNNFGVFQIR
jgi:hypothetical protein